MILRDWRQADAGLLRACYEREQRSWRDDLGWDTAWTWATIEVARVTRGLPGLLAAADDGRVHGWAFHMRQDDTCHLGGLVASSHAVTGALLDGVLEGAADTAAACFIRERAPGLAAALTSRGFDVERFLYLSCALGGVVLPADESRTDGWRDPDLPHAAALLQASYTPAAARHFAPTGTLDGWTRYVAGIVSQGGCGVLDPALTRLARDERGLEAMALVTSLAPQTAHLAQLAVRPDCRGRGLGASLLLDAMVRAGQAGKSALTLIVSERNHVARALYAANGFVERGVFIAARRERAADTAASLARSS
jgi:ribosomal protein S18 acetylase RimI-like enzyme